MINLRKNKTSNATLSQGSYVLCSLLLILSTFAEQMYSFDRLDDTLNQTTQNCLAVSEPLENILPVVKVKDNVTTPLPFMATNWISDNFDSSLVFQQYESWDWTGKIFRDTNIIEP